MNGTNQQKQPAVRPGLLIVLLVVLGATLYWRFFTQPKPAPSVPTPQPAPVLTNINNINAGEQMETRDRIKIQGPVSKRDIFLPPTSVIAARRKKEASLQQSYQPVQPVQPVGDGLTLIRPDQEIKKEDENPEKPELKVIVGTASNQVIVVRYRNKSYLLKLGEILPGTEYRVTEIQGSSVILQSPKGSLKLEKKERAK
ncbi:MAG: hypothetical protein GX075_08855 [Firmicutes bacterium]|nr:hypothetical protein [Bacillota bacterium]